MKTLKTLLLSTLIVALVSLTYNSAVSQEKKKAPWVAPETAKKMKNPTTADKDNLAMGKSLYMKHCKSCHGPEGKGDGPKTKELDTKPISFHDAKFQAQTDGELFWKTKEGKDDMPAFKKKIANDEDVWLIVNYVRTLK